MLSTYEIFDLISGNVLDVFSSEREAIDALIEIAHESGFDQLTRFALFREEAGESSLVAMKDDLMRRVEADHSTAASELRIAASR